MNKKVLLSIASLAASSVLVVGATFAFFSDSGTSNDNVFATGTLDLKLSDDTAETDQDNVTASFGGSDMAPDECTGTQQLRAKNSGSINGDHIEISVLNTVTDVGDDASDDIDEFLRLNVFDYDGVPIVFGSDPNGNGFQDLDDLEILGVDSLALADLATDHDIDVDVCLDDSAENELQGDSVDSDWTITLNQHVSQ